MLAPQIWVLFHRLKIVTVTEIRFKEHGTELVEVADNGCGIDKESYQALSTSFLRMLLLLLLHVYSVRWSIQRH